MWQCPSFPLRTASVKCFRTVSRHSLGFISGDLHEVEILVRLSTSCICYMCLCFVFVSFYGFMFLSLLACVYACKCPFLSPVLLEILCVLFSLLTCLSYFLTGCLFLAFFWLSFLSLFFSPFCQTSSHLRNTQSNFFFTSSLFLFFFRYFRLILSFYYYKPGRFSPLSARAKYPFRLVFPLNVSSS